jgi:F-type H+-transporting ATPase subunit epsilon
VSLTLHVEVVVPDREVWSGSARMVVAKTLDGDMGVLSSHPPVLGILAEGSVVRIFDPESSDDAGAAASGELIAAVSSGFLSVADDRVSILARNAELGPQVDKAAARAELEAESEGSPAGGGDESPAARYARARLRAAGEQA